MRLGKSGFLSILILSSTIQAQTSTSPPFVTQILTKYTQLAVGHSLSLSGSAAWTAGSVHESGAILLQASSNGSSTLQLTLGTASRTETRTALGSSRTCQWSDAQSVVHQIVGMDCETALPWFAPLLLVTPVSSAVNLITISDNGVVERSGSFFREISYETVEHGHDASSSQVLQKATQVFVFFDQQSLLPSSVEYVTHADDDLSKRLNVRVLYSNYQMVSGVPIPFRIDRYVNNALQLSLTISNASLN